VTPISTLRPFVAGADDDESMATAMDEFLVKEKVDLVCATDISRADMVGSDLKQPGLRVQPD
jgi:hypothetical protein